MQLLSRSPLWLDRKTPAIMVRGLFVLLDHTFKADDNVLVQPQSFTGCQCHATLTTSTTTIYRSNLHLNSQATHRLPDSSAKAKDCSPRFRKFTLVCPAGRLDVWWDHRLINMGFQSVFPVIFYLYVSTLSFRWKWKVMKFGWSDERYHETWVQHGATYCSIQFMSSRIFF